MHACIIIVTIFITGSDTLAPFKLSSIEKKSSIGYSYNRNSLPPPPLSLSSSRKPAYHAEVYINCQCVHNGDFNRFPTNNPCTLFDDEILYWVPWKFASKVSLDCSCCPLVHLSLYQQVIRGRKTEHPTPNSLPDILPYSQNLTIMCRCTSYFQRSFYR